MQKYLLLVAPSSYFDDGLEYAILSDDKEYVVEQHVKIRRATQILYWSESLLRYVEGDTLSEEITDYLRKMK